MKNIRVRFAPSPTGALHIGGVRTALYNYLFAKKTGGTFLLRIEDTDQTRYVPGAEKYIMEALKWCGIMPTEGPHAEGEVGPYRQSERKQLYRKYAEQLVANGHAYYAFDTSEELAALRKAMEAEKKVMKYDASLRLKMKNSLTLPADEVERLIKEGNYTIRLKVPADEIIHIKDLIRGDVQFHGSELDDKIMLKADGMPTYHMANIVDDYLMKISHVIRGEEWLPSTAHHVLLYRFLGLEEHMPQFAHLPLILKPTGKGKLSKRDGSKFGIPVFPLSWEDEKPEDSFIGFREFGFDPQAVLNFVAFLGWNPGTEQEIFSLEGLVDAFSVERIGKSGARFDFDKAKWFNQQYIIATDNKTLAAKVRPYVENLKADVSDDFLEAFCGMMKERVDFLPDFIEKGYYFFQPVKIYDNKTIRKKWKPENAEQFEALRQMIAGLDDFSATNLETSVKQYVQDNEMKMGEVFPILRVAMTGVMKGPSLFDMMALLGKTEVDNRLFEGYRECMEVHNSIA